MPYRTPAEKPMKITVELTNNEIKEAVRLYVSEKKNLPIPEQYTKISFTRDEVAGKTVGFQFEFSEP